MNLDLLSTDVVVSNRPARKAGAVAAMTVRTGVRAGQVTYKMI